MYNSIESTTTPMEVEDVRNTITGVLGECVYNNYQLKLFAEGYRLQSFVEAEFDFSDYLRWLGDMSQGTFDEKLTRLFSIKITELQRKHIEEYGYSLMGVGAGDVDPSYTYTVGLSKILGFELVVVNLPLHLSSPLLNGVIDNLKKGNVTPDVVFTDDEFTIEDVLARLKITDIDMDSNTAEGVKGRIDGIEVTQIKQLWLPDQNNVLPDEPGYDNTFMQTLVGE